MEYKKFTFPSDYEYRLSKPMYDFEIKATRLVRDYAEFYKDGVRVKTLTADPLSYHTMKHFGELHYIKVTHGSMDLAIEALKKVIDVYWETESFDNCDPKKFPCHSLEFGFETERV